MMLKTLVWKAWFSSCAKGDPGDVQQSFSVTCGRGNLGTRFMYKKSVLVEDW